MAGSKDFDSTVNEVLRDGHSKGSNLDGMFVDLDYALDGIEICEQWTIKKTGDLHRMISATGRSPFEPHEVAEKLSQVYSEICYGAGRNFMNTEVEGRTVRVRWVTASDGLGVSGEFVVECLGPQN